MTGLTNFLSYADDCSEVFTTEFLLDAGKENFYSTLMGNVGFAV
jgi:hypothetical protein